MSKTILGISAFYHDSAAALVRDGEIIAAAQEERFSRRKHDPRFPSEAINYCLEEAYISRNELDAVVFYENPVLAFDRVLKNYLTVAPRGIDQWKKAARSMLGVKATIRKSVEQALGKNVKLLFVDHHLAHAASAFYPSPFVDAAILTADGVGEWATTTLGVGRNNCIELLKEIRYPHSLGLLYSAMTYFCGFKVNSGEHKLMGLAPYGQPLYADLIKKNLIDIKEDGSFRLNLKYFGFLDTDRITNVHFEKLFEGSPRQPESEITTREKNLAASIQAVTEEVMLKLARHAQDITGSRNLAMAGGVALNCVANSKIQDAEIFDRIWIQPAAGDAGGALGAALLGCYQYFSAERKLSPQDSQKGSYLGPQYSRNEIVAFLERHAASYTVIESSEKRARLIANELAEGKIVGYMSGRAEFGPRALGARSILADPRPLDMQSRLNQKIKFRESFRPFAPAVLCEQTSKCFEMNGESPYMMLTAKVKNDRIPAVTHIDQTARVQTVNATDHEDFHRILTCFNQLTGCPVLVNTSFNVRGEPIVCSPNDAYRCFMKTGIDLLVMEDCLLWKDRQPPLREKQETYELD